MQKLTEQEVACHERFLVSLERIVGRLPNLPTWVHDPNTGADVNASVKAALLRKKVTDPSAQLAVEWAWDRYKLAKREATCRFNAAVLM